MDIAAPAAAEQTEEAGVGQAGGAHGTAMTEPPTPPLPEEEEETVEATEEIEEEDATEEQGCDASLWSLQQASQRASSGTTSAPGRFEKVTMRQVFPPTFPESSLSSVRRML